MAGEYLLGRCNEMKFITRPVDKATQITLIFQETEDNLAELLGRCTSPRQSDSFKNTVLEKCGQFVDNQDYPLLAKAAKSLRDKILAMAGS